jgi:hypothetical protein
MAILKKYVGDDITHAISEVSGNAVPVAINLDNYAEMIVIYSSRGNQIKFSKTVKEGYKLLVKLTSYIYAAYLSSADTILLGYGQVTVSTNFVKTSLISDLRDNVQAREITFILLETETSNEL